VIVRKLRIVLSAAMLVLPACSRLPQQPLTKGAKEKPKPTQPSAIGVQVNPGGPVVFRTSAAEFQVRPDGYIQAFLLKDGQELSLDDPQVGMPSESDYVVIAGKEVHFTLDFQQAQVLEAVGKTGVGKRVEIPARPLGPSGTELQRVLALEIYDRFPTILLSTVEYKNTGATELRIEKSVDQRHRLSATLADAKSEPWEMWSFHGASHDWRNNEIVQLTRKVSQPKTMGEMVKSDAGVPVAAFWTGQVGEAIGPVETIPSLATITAKVDRDGRVDTEVDFVVNTTLKPGETYSSPRSFVSVYAGDFYEPMRTWAMVLQNFVSATPPAPIEEHWRKWIGLYKQKTLSKGEFKDLYIHGKDMPEGHAVAKDGKMYYAFFAPSAAGWKGEVELRGLKLGRYRVTDGGERKSLGSVEAAANGTARMAADFKAHLLLEVSPQP
jgi:hypothetical protein